MVTFDEAMDHPERMTDEDKKYWTDLFATVKEFGKATAAYNIKIDREVVPQMIASDFYQEHLIMAAILEAFIEQNEISLQKLNQSICNRIPADFLYDLPVSYTNGVIQKMIRFGYIMPIDIGNKYMLNFRITEDGIKALKNQTFQSLASTSFFNKQTFDFNRQSQSINKKMLVMTILMLIATIASVTISVLAISRNKYIGKFEPQNGQESVLLAPSLSNSRDTTWMVHKNYYFYPTSICLSE